MSLFRCENDICDSEGVDFEGETGECPTCHGFLTVELLPVHYLVPADGPIKTALGNRMIACDPTMKAMPQCSGDRVAVTCLRCKAGEIFKEDERDKISNHVQHFERIVAKKLAASKP